MPAPGGSIAVYRAGLDGVLLADRGARGRLFFSGRQVSDLFHRISTNDIRALAPGQGTPSLLLTGKGRILDRLLILAVEGGLLVFTSAGTGEETSERIRKYIVFEEVSTADHTPETFLWELSGPLSVRLLEESAGAPGPEDGWLSLPLGHHRVILMGGRKVRVIRDMDLEAPSFLLCGRAGDWEGVAQVLKEKGTPLGLVFGADVPGGETALEALRIRAGRPAPDHELSEEWNPLEMRQEDALSFTKGCYVGQEVIARLRTYDRVKRRLVRLKVEGTAPVPPGSSVAAAAGAGSITSAAICPGTEETVALAVLERAACRAGASVTVGAVGGGLKGVIQGDPVTARDSRAEPPPAASPGRRRFRT